MFVWVVWRVTDWWQVPDGTTYWMHCWSSLPTVIWIIRICRTAIAVIRRWPRSTWSRSSFSLPWSSLTCTLPSSWRTSSRLTTRKNSASAKKTSKGSTPNGPGKLILKINWIPTQSTQQVEEKIKFINDVALEISTCFYGASDSFIVIKPICSRDYSAQEITRPYLHERICTDVFFFTCTKSEIITATPHSNSQSLANSISEWSDVTLA